MEYCLETHDLCKSYGRFKALSGLTLHVPKGAIYGLVGRNGAGKTTLLRLICGLQRPDSGHYTIYGVDGSDRNIGSIRRRMGAVVETPAFCRDMTARDNLVLQYKALGLPSYDGIDEILRMVGLSDTGQKKAKHFSLGMKQRLGIAVALCGHPDFIVLDEPVNGMDPEGIVEIRELILRLNREQQITFLISSHILEELSKLATHYGFIDSGATVKEISAREWEASCRQCIRLTVSDTKAVCCALDGMGETPGGKVEYAVVSDSEVDVFGEVNITRLVVTLQKSGCEVLSLHERSESLENYYINLMGGGNHA